MELNISGVSVDSLHYQNDSFDTLNYQKIMIFYLMLLLFKWADGLRQKYNKYVFFFLGESQGRAQNYRRILPFPIKSGLGTKLTGLQ